MSALTDRLDEWDALAEKATPGPWEVGTDRAAVWTASPDTYLAATVAEMNDDPYFRGIKPEADAEFIARARTAVPTLVAALRAVLDEHHSVPVYLLTDLCGHADDDHEVMESDMGDTLCLGSPTGEFECDTCLDDESYHVPWPCRTVRAITSALGVES